MGHVPPFQLPPPMRPPAASPPARQVRRIAVRRNGAALELRASARRIATLPTGAHGDQSLDRIDRPATEILPAHGLRPASWVLWSKAFPLRQAQHYWFACIARLPTQIRIPAEPVGQRTHPRLTLCEPRP